MKKELLTLVLVMVLYLSLSACNSSTKPDEQEDETDEATKVVQVVDEITECEFKGVTYEVPSDWEEKDINKDNKYYYPDNGMLMVMVDETTHDSIMEADNQKEFIEGIEKTSDYLTVTQEGTITINDQDAYRIVADMGMSDRDFEAEIITFNTSGGIAMFFMGTYTDTESTEAYKNEFDSILKSISFTPYTQEDQEAETQEAETSAPEEQAKPEITTGQSNALSKAREYLSIMSFSYTGLIEQLEYEEFSNEEATYGADNCGADWNEQAAKKAQEYIDLMSYSRQGLIDQLIYEGFTTEQAEYGVSAVGY